MARDFDSSKDVKLAEISRFETGSGSIVVDVMQYDNAEPKLQITRAFDRRNGTEGRSRLGRVTLSELDGLFYAIEKGKEYLEYMNPSDKPDGEPEGDPDDEEEDGEEP